MIMSKDAAAQGRRGRELRSKGGFRSGALGLGAFAIVLVFLLASNAKAQPQAPSRSAGATTPGDVSSEALGVFQAKCAACHGPQAAKPKKFAYITDLKRLAANPKYVIPHDPDKSGLWQSIDEGDMPPDDAKTGQLSDAQKQTVRNWIEMGAPAPSVVATASADPKMVSASKADAGGDPATAPLPFGKRFIRWLGRFHPLMVHFPVALLVAAALAELAWLKTRQDWLVGAVRFCVLFGAAGALVAGGLGWINASYHTRSALLTTHTWLGTLAALWAVPTALLSERGFRKAGPTPIRGLWTARLPFQLLLFAGVLLISVAAHMGGELVYGVDYFRL
jgi:uncharacterized membrane protein/mono/diheme cytochrome c family protein